MNKLWALSLTALLTGCFKIGPDYVRPQVDTPKQWRFSESNVRQNATNLKWWEELGDPVLNRLVNQSVQGNLDLKIALANIDQFMGQYGSTRANLFPQISGVAHYAHAQPSSGGGDVLNSGSNGKELDYMAFARSKPFMSGNCRSSMPRSNAVSSELIKSKASAAEEALMAFIPQESN